MKLDHFHITEGEPGLVPQGPNVSAVVTNRATTENKRDFSIIKNTKIVAEDIVERIKVGLVPTKVTATVSVPSSHYRRIWSIANPTAEGEAPKSPTPAELLQLEEKINGDIQRAVVSSDVRLATF